VLIQSCRWTVHSWKTYFYDPQSKPKVKVSNLLDACFVLLLPLMILAVVFGYSIVIPASFYYFRCLRYFSNLPSYKFLIRTCISALRNVLTLLLLFGNIVIVYTILGVTFFGDNFDEFFGNVPKGLFTMFQVMSLESWASQIARPIMAEREMSWLYFVSFIIITTYVLLNIFVAILVDAVIAASENNTRINVERSSEAESSECHMCSQQLTLLKEMQQQLQIISQKLATGNETVEASEL